MTDAQFSALSKLIRLRPGSSADAARRVLVDGLSIGDAAAEAGRTYQKTWDAVQRCRAALDLARTAAGC